MYPTRSRILLHASYSTCCRVSLVCILLPVAPHVPRSLLVLVPHVSCALCALVLYIPRAVRAIMPHVPHTSHALLLKNMISNPY